MAVATTVPTDVLDWLVDNGIPPGNIPLDAQITLGNGQMLTEVYDTDDSGNKYIDRQTGRPARCLRKFTVSTPNATVFEWLAARNG